MTIDLRIGAAVTAKRQALNSDAASLGHAVGVSERDVLAWEAGTERIPPGALVTLAKVLRCSISYFFDENRR